MLLIWKNASTESPVILLINELVVRGTSSIYLCYGFQLHIVSPSCFLHNGLAQNSHTSISVLKAVILKTAYKQKIDLK